MKKGPRDAALSIFPGEAQCLRSFSPYPKSGLPDFGINNAQVGQARPAWEKVGMRGRFRKLRLSGSRRAPLAPTLSP